MRPNFIFALVILALLAAPLMADQLADELSNFNAALEADVTIQNNALVASPQLITVTIAANNPYSTPMPLYILREGQNGWEVVKLLGALPPKEKTALELEIEVHYDKQTRSETRYAIVGRGEDGQLYGSNFYIKEDWSQYERNINESLSAAMLTYVPIVGFVLVMLLVLVARTAYASRSKGIVAGEYTLKTLVFPQVEGRPFEEKIADMMINPLIILLELACVAILAVLMFGSITQSAGLETGTQIMLLSAIGSFSIPFIYFAAAWYFEKREEGKPLRFFAGIFVWGMFAAFLSLIASSSIASGLKDLMVASYVIIAIMLISPIVEETAKGLGVLFMSGHHEYNDTLTGLLLGFTAGAGFAFVENWFYFSSKSDPFGIGLVGWGTLILYRSFFNTLAHGCFTAAISTLIGYLRGVERLKKFARLAFAPGLFLAVAIHAIFNLSALADSFVVANRQQLFFIFNPMLIILLVAMFFLVLVLAIIDEKKRRMRRSGWQAAAQQ